MIDKLAVRDRATTTAEDIRLVEIVESSGYKLASWLLTLLVG
ncbi:MAG: hypothetical protein OXC57_08430 [Rhodobacteraceae bacterium]|nr:hypothetical protein [Paracoccaceae bacterium]